MGWQSLRCVSIKKRSIFVTQNLAYAYEVVLSVTRVTIKNLAYAYEVFLLHKN